MDIQTPMVFDSLEPMTIEVKIAGEEYFLREASEAGASRYRNELMKSTRVIESADGNRQATVDGISNTEALLLSVCLFKKTPNGGHSSVDINTLKTWPHRVVKPLFDKAEEMSGLRMMDTEESLRKRLKDTQDKLKKYQAVVNTNDAVEGSVKNS